MKPYSEKGFNYELTKEYNENIVKSTGIFINY